MTRNLTAPMQTAAQLQAGELVYLFELAFSGGTLRYTTAGHDLSWNGQTWTAIGGHLSFDGVQEQRDLRGQSVPITLDGVNQAVISALLGGNYIGRLAKIYVGHVAIEDNLLPYSEDFSEWLGNATRTSNQSDPFGGSAAYDLEDDDGLAWESRYYVVGALEDAQYVLGGWVKYVDSADVQIKLFDADAAANRGDFKVAFDADGNPSFTAASGSILESRAYPDGWWLVRALLDAPTTPGNSHRIDCFPAHNTAADTGHALFYGIHFLRKTTCLAYTPTEGAAKSAGELLDDPYTLFSGYMNDAFTIEEQPGGTCQVRTSFVSPLTRFEQSRGIRASVTSHQHHFANDAFWRHILGLAGRDIWWGNNPVSGRIGGGGWSGGNEEEREPQE